MNDLQPGQRIGAYEIRRVAGRGAVGVVYEAEHTVLGRLVAIKTLNPLFMNEESFRARFSREAQGAASVDHPNIITVFDVGEHERLPYLVMTFVSGPDLERVLTDRGGRLEPAESVLIGSAVAGALDAAGASGLAHRDVKPANILLEGWAPERYGGPRRTPHVYLTDFGLIKGSAQAAVTRTGQFVGTLLYMAPEQIENKAVPASDQYSLACVLWECLTGTYPFTPSGNSTLSLLTAHLSEPVPRISDRPGGMDRGLDAVFRRALAKDPAERYASCRAFVDALTRALGLGNAAPVPAVEPPLAALRSTDELERPEDTRPPPAGATAVIPIQPPSPSGGGAGPAGTSPGGWAPAGGPPAAGGSGAGPDGRFSAPSGAPGGGSGPGGAVPGGAVPGGAVPGGNVPGGRGPSTAVSGTAAGFGGSAQQGGPSGLPGSSRRSEDGGNRRLILIVIALLVLASLAGAVIVFGDQLGLTDADDVAVDPDVTPTDGATAPADDARPTDDAQPTDDADPTDPTASASPSDQASTSEAPPGSGIVAPVRQGRIAFVTTTDVWVADVTGGGLTNVTQGTVPDAAQPAWQPGGDLLVVSSADGLRSIDPGDPGVAQTLTDSGSHKDPSWSPDGDLLAFTAVGEAGEPDLAVRPTAGTTQLLGIADSLPDGVTGVPQRPAVSGDGVIAFHLSDGQSLTLWTVGVDGQGLARVPGIPDGDAFHPAWTPEGDLMFSLRDGSADRVLVLESDLFTTREVAAEGPFDAKDGDPSPCGDHVAYEIDTEAGPRIAIRPLGDGGLDGDPVLMPAPPGSSSTRDPAWVGQTCPTR